MEPGFLKFEECFMERIWGGDQLRRVLGKAVPDGKIIGESWMIADHAEHTSVVKEGPFSGCTLHQLMEKDRIGLLGANAATTGDGRFPLLLKLIDAAEDLSIQVHPDDEQVLKYGTDRFGKTECWYIIDAQKDSELIIGFKQDVTNQDIKNSLNNGNLLSLLNTVKVYPGQVYLIPSGTVHAIMGKTLLYEIQQTSDTTFRLYDWDRKDKAGSSRQLHVKEALEVSDKKSYPSYHDRIQY